MGVDKLFQVNSNFKALAEAKLDKTGDASNTTTKFTQASSRVNLTSGEKLSVSLGKIMKFIADVISSGVAFYKVVNNGTTTAANTLLDGRYGKTLFDLIESRTNGKVRFMKMQRAEILKLHQKMVSSGKLTPMQIIFVYIHSEAVTSM